MTLHDDEVLVFGLTGAFGSGVTSLGKALEAKRQFHTITISNIIKESWRAAQRGEFGDDHPEATREPVKGELQDCGDAFRLKNPAYWVQQVVAQAQAQDGVIRRLAIDGIRNPAEVRWLRERFKNFFLVAVDAPPDVRWERLRDTEPWQGLLRRDFDAASARDIEAPQEWGQRVQQCVDIADYVITNDGALRNPAAHLLKGASDLIELIESGKPGRRPSDAESFMHMAYATSTRSACLKRGVGAVVVRPGGVRPISERFALHSAITPIAVGHNDKPDWMAPCYERYGGCFRDQWREEQMKGDDWKNCPRCGSAIKKKGWPYVCSNKRCETQNALINVVFPDRGMSHCTAIHAEVRAILNAKGADLAGAHLYTTTFPCFSCAGQIIQAGITTVVYVEPYPDADARDLLRDHGIETVRFSGVKSLAFPRLFGSWRERLDQELSRAS